MNPTRGNAKEKEDKPLREKTERIRHERKNEVLRE